MENVIIGASSGLGRQIAENLARRGKNILIISRNERDLVSIANDLQIRFSITIKYLVTDINNKEETKKISDYLDSDNSVAHVYITSGYITDTDDGFSMSEHFDLLVDTNYKSVIRIIAIFTNYFKAKGKGNIIICSSIAVIRPRKSNVIYGSSKAALDFYARALQHQFSKSRIKIQLYRLGYMNTAMTYGKKLLLPNSNTDIVAQKIIKNRTKNVRLKYLPSYWKIVELILKHLPWFIYKRISF